jgi:hypothetical protein
MTRLFLAGKKLVGMELFMDGMKTNAHQHIHLHMLLDKEFLGLV